MANTGDHGFEAGVGRTNPPAGQERRTEGAKEGGMVSAVTDRIKDLASTAAEKASDESGACGIAGATRQPGRTEKLHGMTPAPVRQRPDRDQDSA